MRIESLAGTLCFYKCTKNTNILKYRYIEKNKCTALFFLRKCYICKMYNKLKTK